MKPFLPALLLLLLLLPLGAAAEQPTTEVLGYHGDAARTGNFVIPALTYAAASKLHRDPRFQPRIQGAVNAQPLFWKAGTGTALLIVATEADDVYALNAQTGATVWEEKLGTPVKRSELPCGDIFPLGITGTPVIDAGRQAVYLDAMIEGRDGRPEHAIFGLSLKDGSVLPGWPVDVAAALKRQGVAFNTSYQNQRGALAVLGDRIYVPFGGHDGDCGTYHGWVLGVRLDQPHALIQWHTQAGGGAVWAPAGVSSDGSHLFVATGNTMDAEQWGGGEAVVRLSPDLRFSGPADYFAPADWRTLDDRDLDLGGVAPVLFDLGARHLAISLGKDGKAYLLDRDRLAGVGSALVSKEVSTGRILAAAAAVPMGSDELVAFGGRGSDCPRGGGNGLTVLKVSAAPATIATAWCASVDGRAAPIATTIDGVRDAIFWMVGAEGDDRLHGFRAANGQQIYESGELAGLEHFQTLIATPRRLFVAADGAVYAFAF
ncbi:MAG: hypothetical protein ACREFW_03570 [Rhizomicrobium sp.]